MIIHDCEQRSEKWFKLRCGKITASNAHRLLTPVKFMTFARELIAEQVTGSATEHFVSEAMQWGIDNEPFAMEWYQKHTGYEVQTVGFVEHDSLFAGCSPDLMVTADDVSEFRNGLAQIKCPTSKTHIEYIQSGVTPEIMAQMQFEMWICDAPWNDFVSYDPRFPESTEGHILRVHRSEELIKKIEQKTIEIITFVDEFMFERGLPRKSLNVSDAKTVANREAVRDEWGVLRGDL